MSKLPILPPELPINAQDQEKTPWYREGLCFSCTGCGGCCTGAPGYVWVSEEEMQVMAHFLGMPLSAFSRRYTRVVDGRYSLTETRNHYDCIFLEGKRCTIYPVRPVQCRTFPFWPENLVSKEAWEAAKEHCEGIHDQAERVSFDQIEERRLQNLEKP